MTQFAPLDLAAIFLYFLATALIAWRVSRRNSDPEDLFLAGRSLGPLAVGFSLFASNISSDTLIGLPGAAYLHGLSVANYEWMAGIVLMFTAAFVLPVLMRSRITTMPELMGRRFDLRMRRYLAAVTLFLSLVLDTAATLYAGALMITAFVPALGLAETALGLALFTGIYTAAGGLRAVVYTDVMQAIVLLAGSAVLAWIVFGQYDWSWAEVTARIDPDRLSLIRPLDDPGVPWLGLLTGLPVVGFYYWTMNQYIVQRVLGARDLEAAGKASLFAALLKLLPLFLMTLPGILAAPLLPGLEHPDQVFPAMVSRFVPAGLTGLIVAGILAALMSTCSATLNSAATLVTLDFVRPTLPRLSPARLVWIGRATTIVLTLLAAIWAPMIQRFEGLWSYLQQVFAFVASPLVAVFLMGLWSRRLGARAALRGLVSGHVLSAGLFLARETGMVTIHFTIISGILCAATAIFTFLWMLRLDAADRPDEAQMALVADPASDRPSRVLAVRIAAVLAVTLAVIWMFR